MSANGKTKERREELSSALLSRIVEIQHMKQQVALEVDALEQAHQVGKRGRLLEAHCLMVLLQANALCKRVCDLAIVTLQNSDPNK